MPFERGEILFSKGFFYLAGHIESWGRGIEKIFDSCIENDLPIANTSWSTFSLYVPSLFSKTIRNLKKAFAVGMRIEHSQEFINKNQYGKFYDHPALKAFWEISNCFW